MVSFFCVGARVPDSTHNPQPAIRHTRGQILTLSLGTRVVPDPALRGENGRLFLRAASLARCEESAHALGRGSARLRRLTSSQIADEALKFLVAQQELATDRDQLIYLRLL